MRIVIDLNIWIDIAARPSSFPESIELYRRIEEGFHKACLPLCAYTTLYYLLAQLIGKKGALEFLASIEARGVEFLLFSKKEVSLAEKLSFSDYEDACVAASAVNSNCEYIITRNVSDFKRSPVPALAPKLFIKHLTNI